MNRVYLDYLFRLCAALFSFFFLWVSLLQAWGKSGSTLSLNQDYAEAIDKRIAPEIFGRSYGSLFIMLSAFSRERLSRYTQRRPQDNIGTLHSYSYKKAQGYVEHPKFRALAAPLLLKVARTQSLTLLEQMQAGADLFDVRCSRHKGILVVDNFVIFGTFQEFVDDFAFAHATFQRATGYVSKVVLSFAVSLYNTDSTLTPKEILQTYQSLYVASLAALGDGPNGRDIDQLRYRLFFIADDNGVKTFQTLDLETLANVTMTEASANTTMHLVPIGLTENRNAFTGNKQRESASIALILCVVLYFVFRKLFLRYRTSAPAVKVEGYAQSLAHKFHALRANRAKTHFSHSRRVGHHSKGR